MQGLTPESIKEWYDWGGGSARITLDMACKDPGGLESYKNYLNNIINHEDLVVSGQPRTQPCHQPVIWHATYL